ncbi:hypothetical protein D3C75_1131850 [compost metagenome]
MTNALLTWHKNHRCWTSRLENLRIMSCPTRHMQIRNLLTFTDLLDVLLDLLIHGGWCNREVFFPFQTKLVFSSNTLKSL